MHRSMPVVVSIHSVLTCWSEGLRVVGREPEEGAREGGRNQLLLVRNMITF